MGKGSKRKDGGEVLRDAKEGTAVEHAWHIVGDRKPLKKPRKSYKYVRELARLELELIKLQHFHRRQR